MNPEQILAHFKRLTSTLSTGQLVSLAAAFVGVVAVTVGSAYWINAPTYSLLFSDMDAESANSVVAKLKTDKVPYVLGDDGRSVRVPHERLDDLRLEFSGQGMPGSGRIGFEIFDRTAFGMTEFIEKVTYRRGLEGELARTIATLGEVSSARVHITMAKDSLFATDAQPAKASVVLKLRDRKPLSQATVNGITGLVAGAVETLRPEAVVILDTFGRPLTRQPGEADDAGSGLQLDQQRRLERDLSAKVVALLEPIVGIGHARVNVTAQLDGNSVEETVEQWDPASVVRAKATATDASGPTTPVLGGISGARGNAPPTVSTSTPQTLVGSGGQTATHSVENTNYEISKTTRHRIVPRGQIKRLSVAVVLDDQHTTTKDSSGALQPATKPLDSGELQRLQHLVASSVGLDADRGDEVTVENIAFGDEGIEVAAPPPTLLERVSPLVQRGGAAFEIGRIVAIMALAAFAFFAILRPMARNALQLPPALQAISSPLLAGESAQTVADLTSQIEADLDGSLDRPRRLEALTKRLTKSVEQEPEHVARLVRSLLTEEDR